LFGGFGKGAVRHDTCGWSPIGEGFELSLLRCDPADFDRELRNTNSIDNLGRYDAFGELRKATVARRIDASGIEYGGDNKRHLIPTLDWHELYLEHERTRVIKQWPRRSPKASRQSREKTKDWFVELIDKSPERSPKPVPELTKEAANKFRISEDGAREAYQQARQERPGCRWKAGRRPKQGA
jgi:hypothetical protein